MKLVRTSVSALVLILSAGAPSSVCAESKRATENLLIVMTDGLRWQEVFTGADEALLNKERGGIPNAAEVRKEFWRDDVQERRAALMPFTWSVLAKQGQLYGNRLKGSTAKVTNGLNFSYPGYSETFCGFADSRIDSNKKFPNPNVNVLEWLNQKPLYKDRVAVVASWDVFPSILNEKRSGLALNAGFEPLKSVPETPELRLLNRLIAETPPRGEETRYDAFTYYAALEYLKVKKPRVFLVSFDETDNFGHAGRYDRVLTAAQKVDGYVKNLWETMQAMPEYRGKTTLVFAPDHGRGDPPTDWKSHGKKIKGSEYIWIGVLGPDTPPLGERTEIPDVTQSQIAATLAALLGEDYCAATPKAAKPIGDVSKAQR